MQYQFPISPTRTTARSRHLPPPDATTIRTGTRNFTERLPPFNNSAPLIQHIAKQISRYLKIVSTELTCTSVTWHATPDGIGISKRLAISKLINVGTPLKYSTTRQMRLERPPFFTALTWQQMRSQFVRGQHDRHFFSVSALVPSFRQNI